MSVVVNNTLVDTCNFPTIRFGRYYVDGKLSLTTTSGNSVVSPDATSYYVSQDGQAPKLVGYVQTSPQESSSGHYEIQNLIGEGFPSVLETGTTSWISPKVGIRGRNINRQGAYIVSHPRYATSLDQNTVISDFGGVASQTRLTDGIAQGRVCPPVAEPEPEPEQESGLFNSLLHYYNFSNQ